MKIVVSLVLWLGLVLSVGTSAQAEAPPAQTQVKIDKSRLLVPPRGANRITFLESPTAWLIGEQQSFYTGMSTAIRSLSVSGQEVAAAWTLMLLSFGYGVLHAAGPGHGKAVISGWLLASEQHLHRGIMVSALSSLVQAITAIIIVSGILLVVALAGGVARDAASDVGGWLQRASYAMISGLGIYLLWQAFRRWPIKFGDDHHSHKQFHEHHSTDPHDNCDCGHSHIPASKDVAKGWSLGRAMSLSLAVGIRPCTGSLLVLLFANAAGLYLAGIAAIFAMALGTFITVSVIATLAVMSKKLALRLAGDRSNRLQWVTFGLRLGGGVVITALGIFMFVGSLSGSQGVI